MSGNGLKSELIEKETLYQGFFKLERFHLKYEKFEGGWSEVIQREIFERGNAAAALLLDPEQELLVMVEQFRPGAMSTEKSPWLIEPIAGMIEKGESPKNLIEREAEEEAGCQIKRMRKICEYLVSPGGSTERIWLFLAEVDARQASDYAGLEHEHEDIKVHQIPVKKAFQMLENGEFTNAMTLISLQWLKLNWSQNDLFE
ncbi:NUDIX domain-containing protein [Aliikangiella sp. G2MR2-5]|uniref:NUDIX domain-containing protein n=1 Tax=Aliikangiella sp. G2MR2-5 TaxID=2788943 RepID=UPI0018A94584|nr:NUDIX domain-containing protein [Aliikangiella sp. G2MR2-5]